MGWYIATEEMEQAGAKCLRCGEPIKEGRRMYFLNNDLYSHFACELDQIEKEQKEK